MNRVNDQVRKRQEFECYKRWRRTFYDLRTIYGCNNGISGIHGRCLSFIGDERIINLQRTKVYVFSNFVLCLGKILQKPESNEAWERRLGWIKSSHSYRNFDRIDGEPTEFEWNIFPCFNTLQFSEEVKSLLYRLGETPEYFTRRIFHVDVLKTFVEQKTMKKECLTNAGLVSLYARRFGKGQWSFIGPGSEKVHQENGTILRKRCWLNSLRADVQLSVATTPLSRGQLKSKRHGKLSNHLATVQETIETFA